jgi:hypothetical protein
MGMTDYSLFLYGWSIRTCAGCGEKDYLHPMANWNSYCFACHYVNERMAFIEKAGERLAISLIRISEGS